VHHYARMDPALFATIHLNFSLSAYDCQEKKEENSHEEGGILPIAWIERKKRGISDERKNNIE